MIPARVGAGALTRPAKLRHIQSRPLHSERLASFARRPDEGVRAYVDPADDRLSRPRHVGAGALTRPAERSSAIFNLAPYTRRFSELRSPPGRGRPGLRGPCSPLSASIWNSIDMVPAHVGAGASPARRSEAPPCSISRPTVGSLASFARRPDEGVRAHVDSADDRSSSPRYDHQTTSRVSEFRAYAA